MPRLKRGDLGSEWVSISEAAGLLYVHTNTLRRWANIGLIEYARVGPRRDRRFRRSDVSRFMQRYYPTGMTDVKQAEGMTLLRT